MLWFPQKLQHVKYQCNSNLDFGHTLSVRIRDATIGWKLPGASLVRHGSYQIPEAARPGHVTWLCNGC
eukprot:3527910-Amphidinium_carterae.1